MRKVLLVIWGLLTGVFGTVLLVLQKGWAFLDVAGRTEVATKVPTWTEELAIFARAHQDAGWLILPWLLMGLAAYSFALLHWPQLWPLKWPRTAAKPSAPPDKIVTEAPPLPPRPVSPLSEYVPLADAAARLYDYARKNQPSFAAMAESPIMGRAQTPSDILNFFGNYITQQKEVPLYGCRPPAPSFNLIPLIEVKRAQVSDGATTLREKIYSQIEYNDLAIRRGAVENLIAERFEGRAPVVDSVPRATITLEDAVKWITGRSELPRAEQLPSDNEITKALREIRERAQWGAITVFGGKDWYTTPPAEHDNMTRSPIPKEYWADHLIDGIDFLNIDRRGHTRTKSRPCGKDDYMVLWLDRTQVMREWPK